MTNTQGLALSVGVGIGGLMSVLAIEGDRAGWTSTAPTAFGLMVGALGGLLLARFIGRVAARLRTRRGMVNAWLSGLVSGVVSVVAFAVVLELSFSTSRLSFADALPGLPDGLIGLVLGVWTAVIVGFGFGGRSRGSPGSVSSGRGEERSFASRQEGVTS